ncbi:hypothetical protein [Lactobacillus apis]|uniref:hypothetical protein n=1 Tax=Lactobacillus apis TaxID=303541 RepID=UPI002432D60C|nr:hypothetical protein [Lactobacillus apis]
MNGKNIKFDGELDNFKTKDGSVTIQIKAMSRWLSLDKLNDIAEGSISVYLESNQLEMIEQLDDEFKVDDISTLNQEHVINDYGKRTDRYIVTTNDGSIYEISKDLYENLEEQMPDEPESEDLVEAE